MAFAASTVSQRLRRREGRGVRREDQLGPRECEPAGPLGEEVVPAELDAEAQPLALEDREAGVPGLEVELLLPERERGDVHLAVAPEQPAVGADDHRRVVAGALRRSARTAGRPASRRSRRPAAAARRASGRRRSRRGRGGSRRARAGTSRSPAAAGSRSRARRVRRPCARARPPSRGSSRGPRRRPSGRPRPSLSPCPLPLCLERLRPMIHPLGLLVLPELEAPPRGRATPRRCAGRPPSRSK